MVTADGLVKEARSWVGVRWLHQGRSRLGVDCVGLPIGILEALGELPPDFQAPTDYGRLPMRGELERGIEAHCKRAPRALPGTLVLIRWPRVSGPSHVAICTGATLIHAYRKQSGVVEHGFRGPWRRFMTGAWYLPGVSYE